jgi:hypothetical protein
MSTLSIQNSTLRTSHYKVAINVIRVLAVLGVLLLAAAVEVAAADYFDPQHAATVAQSILAW